MTTTALFEFSTLSPSLFRSNPHSVNLLVDMLIMRMLVLPSAIAESWMAPE